MVSVIDLLHKALPDLWCIYLFGSEATGYATPESDIDIALLGPKAYDDLQRWQLAKQLAVILKRDVDLVDLRKVPLTVRMEMLSAAKPIACFDKLQSGLFETHTMSDYGHFVERREPYLQEVMQRGSIYGR